jgi:hypothetical protein
VISVGEPLFAPETIPSDLNLSEEEKDGRLNLCERKVMPEMSEHTFQRTDHMEKMSDSKNVSKIEKSNMCKEFATAEKARYDNAGAGRTPQIIFRAVRE